MQLSAHWTDIASSYIAAASADYASEIEGSVGSEIYGPIFKAGLFIFVSGFVSAFAVAAIVTQSGTWDALEEEFQAGKESQLEPKAENQVIVTQVQAMLDEDKPKSEVIKEVIPVVTPVPVTVAENDNYDIDDLDV